MVEARAVCIIAEHQEGEIHEVFLELSSLGRNIADKMGGQLYALLAGSDIQQFSDKLSSYDVDRIVLVDTSILGGYAAQSYAEGLAPVLQGLNPALILIGATVNGKDLAARLAAKLKTGVASDCVGIEWDEEAEEFQVRHSCYQGKIDRVLHSSSVGAMVAAIRPGIQEVDSPHLKGREPQVTIATTQPVERAMRSRVVDFIRGEPQNIALDEAEVIISGGGGIRNYEDFSLLEELAKLLGGTVGTSRVPVDRGWFPLRKQIGQTGSIVAPKLYLACGISGAIYHAMGMKDSKFIIAINKDRNAPIFDLADLVVVGDLYEIIPELISDLRAEVNIRTEAP